MRAPLPDDQTGDSEDAEAEAITEVLVEAEDWAEAALVCDLVPPVPKHVVSIAEDWFLRISCVSLAFTVFSYSRSA